MTSPVDTQPNQIAILLWALSPDTPHRCATPFTVAAAAAAMDAQVEVYFSAESVRLLASGVAAQIYPGPRREQSLAQFMQQAREHGVRFYGCQASLAAWDLTQQSCAPWLDGVAGSGSIAARGLDPAWRLLVF